jgi:RNA polymerase sigma factor (sigma-70 family)
MAKVRVSSQRAVVVLRYYEDLPEREVAQALGCSVGTVKSQHSKAMEKLRHFVNQPSYAENR